MTSTLTGLQIPSARKATDAVPPCLVQHQTPSQCWEAQEEAPQDAFIPFVFIHM